MKLYNNVKVTTTSNFGNAEIEEYLEPITAHIVVGMNLFKDFLSSFSDIFGGKSKSYQNTLASINDEVVNELRKKANSVGGNCILGLKIDNDEISSQGKSMMMVTATGTVAKAKFSNNEIKRSKQVKSDSINYELLSYHKRKQRYISQSKNESLQVTDELWDFVISNRIHELAEFLLTSYLEFAETHQEYQEDKVISFYNHLIEYLSVIDSEIASPCLYGRLLSNQKQTLNQKIIELITELHLVDFNKIGEILNQDDFQIQKNGVQILNAEKQVYDKDDIPQMENMLELVEQNFNEKGTKSTKKKMLSSKEKEIWKCECEKENDLSSTYCSSCQKDIFGFSDKEVNPIAIKDKLTQELAILRSTINF